jgi:hypothetical protein
MRELEDRVRELTEQVKTLQRQLEAASKLELLYLRRLDLRLAHRATELGAAEGLLKSLQHDLAPLSPVVEARLTDVVQRLRASWLAGPAGLWGDIHPICKLAGSDLDKRVATTLRQGFFQFSQLLCGLEVLLLKSKELGVVSEESLLGLEQLVVKSGDFRGDEIAVADREHRLPDVAGGLERRDSRGDE